MRIVFDDRISKSPRVSIILADWSVRESFHILYYLSNQTIPREQYEVIWIEYYSKRAIEIEAGIEESRKLNIPPIVDKWIVMDMPKNIYYHKHLMYNIGILTAKGKIITFCDSDAIVTPTFVESIIKSFDEDPNIVLHMDEVRNNDKRFYPFNYPLIEEILREGCINWKDGKTTGLLDSVDPLHTRNYGACMSALREDLIKTGGADEHIDYLGHICGPYEMTFRLVNAGKKEVWHQEEFLYHVWHPGQAGQGNYLGPHDRKHMSITALSTRFTGRIMPLVENPSIKMLRLRKELTFEDLLSNAISEKTVENWTVEKVEEIREDIMKKRKFPLLLRWVLFKAITKQFYKVSVQYLKRTREPRAIFYGAVKSQSYFRESHKYYLSLLERCENSIRKLISNGISEIIIYGTDDTAKVVYMFISNSPIKVKGVIAEEARGRVFNLDTLPLCDIKDSQYHILVICLDDVGKKVEFLKNMGVRGEQIIII